MTAAGPRRPTSAGASLTLGPELSDLAVPPDGWRPGAGQGLRGHLGGDRKGLQPLPSLSGAPSTFSSRIIGFYKESNNAVFCTAFCEILKVRKCKELGFLSRASFHFLGLL